MGHRSQHILFKEQSQASLGQPMLKRRHLCPMCKSEEGSTFRAGVGCEKLKIV